MYSPSMGQHVFVCYCAGVLTDIEGPIVHIPALASTTDSKEPASCSPLLKRWAKSWIQRRLGTKRPYEFKGTLLVLLKRYLALDARVRLDKEDPRPTTAIPDTGAGPNVVREDLLPEGWRELSAWAPKSTHVCDALGDLLKARGLEEHSVIVNDKAMQFEVSVVKAMSVPFILGMGYQKEYVQANYPVTKSVLWTNGALSYAKLAWTGKEQQAMPVKGNPVRWDPNSLYQSKGVTPSPRSIQAVYVRCGANGRCVLYERPNKMAKKWLRLQGA